MKKIFCHKIGPLILLSIFVNVTLIAQVQLKQPLMKISEENLVYIGVPNYFVISNDQPFKILNINATEGKIEKLTDTSFIFTIQKASEKGIQFSYTHIKNGKLQKNVSIDGIYLTAFVPDIARIRIGTKSSGKISLNELKLVSRINLDDRNFKMKTNYNILCEINCKPSKSPDKYLIQIRNGDLAGNADFQEMLGKLSKGDRFRVENIKVIGNDNKASNLENVLFIVD